MKTRTSLVAVIVVFAAASISACGSSETSSDQLAAGSGGAVQDGGDSSVKGVAGGAGYGGSAGSGGVGGNGGSGGTAGKGGAAGTGNAGGSAGQAGTGVGGQGGSGASAGAGGQGGLGAGSDYAVRSEYTLAATSPLSNPLVVYLAPNGSDATGTGTPTSPFRTLGKANDYLKTYFQAHDNQDVDVRLQAGVYLNERVSWTLSLPSLYQTRIGPDGSVTQKPILTGCTVYPPTDPATECASSQATAIQLGASRVSVENLMFYRYWKALATTSNSSNHRIVHNIIHYVGNYWMPSLPIGETAIGLNGTGHLVQGNQIRMLRNAGTTNGNPSGFYLHAVYINQGDNNEVANNTISFVEGDPIKFRNHANFNNVHHNAFYRTGSRTIVLESYDSGECASWGNQARNNQYETLYSGALTSTQEGFWYILPGADTTGACSVPDGATARLSTSGNVVVANMSDPGLW